MAQLSDDRGTVDLVRHADNNDNDKVSMPVLLVQIIASHSSI